MERSAQRQCRKGIRADHPGDVVQGIYRRVASEQDRLYYIKGEEWKEAPSDNAERASAQTIRGM